ncbi:hypothetical protein GGX14DRAFT_617917 [Mycena pura]|uniref:Uncharacterized protein n=1 Tax=Mycena pura TaxID=153505 RepID=A0AAD6YHH7_9AGAR|nr:hypothetical protein GGX14DRAFT_617917 [Mycena pura]
MFCNGAWLTPREMNISGSNLSLLRPENAPELFPPSERERRAKARSDDPCTITRGAPIAARGARGGGGRRACACTARAIVESAQRWRMTRVEHAAAEDAECGGDRAGGAGRSRVSAARSKARERRALETRKCAAMARARCTPRRRRTQGVRGAPEQAAGHARCTPGGGGRRACAVHLSRRARAAPMATHFRAARALCGAGATQSLVAVANSELSVQ